MNTKIIVTPTCCDSFVRCCYWARLGSMMGVEFVMLGLTEQSERPEGSLAATIQVEKMVTWIKVEWRWGWEVVELQTYADGRGSKTRWYIQWSVWGKEVQGGAQDRVCAMASGLLFIEMGKLQGQQEFCGRGDTSSERSCHSFVLGVIAEYIFFFIFTQFSSVSCRNLK